MSYVMIIFTLSNNNKNNFIMNKQENYTMHLTVKFINREITTLNDALWLSNEWDVSTKFAEIVFEKLSNQF